jgi:Aspartate ammonia-lyase
VLDDKKAEIIDRVCQRIVDGELHDQFVVGVIQGGAGTSTNMNTNEVIANAGLKQLGLEFGDYSELHPIDDVNRSQSTNDVYPTAIKLAMVFGVQRLLEEHAKLTQSFAPRASSSLTCSRSAAPASRRGADDARQEFSGFAHTLQEDFRPPQRGDPVAQRDQHGGEPRSAPASRPTRATPRRCAVISKSSPASRRRRRPT